MDVTEQQDERRCGQPRREIAKRTHGQPPGQGLTKRTLRRHLPGVRERRLAGQIVDNGGNGAVDLWGGNLRCRHTTVKAWIAIRPET